MISLVFEVFFHVEQKFKQELTNTQVFADVLFHFDWMDVLEIGLLGGAFFQELLNFLDFFCHLHHSYVLHFLLCLFWTPLQILSQVNNL